MSIHTLILPVEPMAGHTAVVVRDNDGPPRRSALAGPAAGTLLDDFLNQLEATGAHRLLSVAAIDNLHVLITVRDAQPGE